MPDDPISAPSLSRFPPPQQWDHWEGYDPNQWPKRVKRAYHIIPTTCFNCEAACGLVAYVEKQTGQVQKFEGNPYHPASRGRNCAKGPATINQINDVDRILYPLKRKPGTKRGEGQWQRTSWDEALGDIASHIRTALLEKRYNEIVYHVGRPGHEGYMDRVLKAWGVDGHNSHTNVCSASARLGYALWQGHDRPSPDYAHARFILLLSAHLESGHYFNPHAQRIMHAIGEGAELAVMDPRLSNTASMAKHWMPTYPGSESAVLLAMAQVILKEGLYDKTFLHDWVNWKTYLKARHPRKQKLVFEDFIQALQGEYAEFTPEYAAKESGIDKNQIIHVARQIGAAGSRFAAHNWRGPSSGNLGGWQVARCLHLLSALCGAVGSEGGTLPNGWSKFKPSFISDPPAVRFWNELHFPSEYPLSHYEMSSILPYLLKQGRGQIDTYFTRVFNPVWTYPDGFSWMEMLRSEKIGLHVALTPTWNETARLADYVLPMGHASERHDLNSYETDGSTWIAFRQPVLRRFAEKNGQTVRRTYEVNPGEVWEEDEFWIDLSWKIDPNGELGIRQHFESPNHPEQPITTEEYYSHIFDRVPNLTETAQQEGLSAYQYMCRYGAFSAAPARYDKHTDAPPTAQIENSEPAGLENTLLLEDEPVGVIINNKSCVGFPTPSRKLELYSSTLAEWNWPEYALPSYIKSHIHPSALNAENEFPLLPTFRLPTMIHSRSANAKWLAETANHNPVWLNPIDATRLGFQTGDLIKLCTEIGYFIDKVWVTEAIKPGIIACSHHIGRWREKNDAEGNRWLSNVVKIEETEPGLFQMRTQQGIEPFRSSDKDSQRIHWRDGGVHQNITHAPHPDPISGMHCWHQKVRVEKPQPTENYGDIQVDTRLSMKIFNDWLSLTKSNERKDKLRRPLWLQRPLRPDPRAFFFHS